jgi:putative transcriptional regulator
MLRFSLDRVMFEKGRMKIPELQEKSGVNKNTLYAIYNNSNTRIDMSVLDRICNALDCTPGDLLEYVPNKEV